VEGWWWYRRKPVTSFWVSLTICKWSAFCYSYYLVSYQYEERLIAIWDISAFYGEYKIQMKGFNAAALFLVWKTMLIFKIGYRQGKMWQFTSEWNEFVNAWRHEIISSITHALTFTVHLNSNWHLAVANALHKIVSKKYEVWSHNDTSLHPNSSDMFLCREKIGRSCTCCCLLFIQRFHFIWSFIHMNSWIAAYLYLICLSCIMQLSGVMFSSSIASLGIRNDSVGFIHNYAMRIFNMINFMTF